MGLDATRPYQTINTQDGRVFTSQDGYYYNAAGQQSLAIPGVGASGSVAGPGSLIVQGPNGPEYLGPGGLYQGFSKPLLSKIRAAMAMADNQQNPVERNPWLPPASINTGPGNLVRANLTAYPPGTMLANAAGTHQFASRTAGTSTAAEPAAMTTPLVTANPYNLGDISDGAALKWSWMGPVRTSTALAGAPSVSSGPKPASLTTEMDFGPVASGAAPYPYFRFFGGAGSLMGLSFYDNFAFNIGASLLSNGGAPLPPIHGFSALSSTVEFMTDAPYIALDLDYYAAVNGLVSGVQVNVEIDGRRLTDGPLMPVATITGNNGYTILDFRASGIRKGRKIRLSTYYSSTLGTYVGAYARFWVTPADSVWFPSNPNRWRMACVGDSIMQGSASGPFLPRWDRASVFADLIGCDDVANLGLGGTGFIAGTSMLGTYIQRIQDVTAINPDVVYIAGAKNDAPGPALVTAAVLYYQALRAALPNAMIIQTGTYGGTSPSALAAIDASLISAVAQFGDSNTYFIPASTDNPPWGTGTGWQGALSGAGNNDIYIGPTDNTHPSQYAIAQYVAFKDANGFKNLINSLSQR